MSDEHKPHDEHKPQGEHDVNDGHGHDDGVVPHAPEAHGDKAHDDQAHAHGESPATSGSPVQDDHHSASEAHGDDAVTADSHGDETHGHDSAADHGPAAAAHDDHGGHDAARAAPAAAAVAASGSTRPPVWSDSGDAPFEDVDTTPVYARGKGGKTRKSDGSSSEGLEIFKTIFFALLIALVLRVVLFQPFTIPSASMEPSLYEGDYIVVSKWSYGYSKHAIPFSPPVFEGRILASEPERGDIVVFKLPRDNKTDYIKRLIGLPGDRIQMIGNVLHINGAPLNNVVVSGADVTNMYGMPIVTLRETLPEGRVITIQDFGPGNDLDDTPMFEVPTGYYFMMGDNRDNSIDSRVIDPSQGVGLVPAENLIGKAEIILFSWTPGASLWNPVSWFTNVRPSRFFTVLD